MKSDALLFLGGTGRIGRAFAVLRDRGRWPGTAPILSGRSDGDWRWNGETAGRIPSGVRAIVHLAGAAGSMDVGATRELARRALRLAEYHHLPLLAASSAAVYSPSDDEHPETDCTRAASRYGKAKLAMEKTLSGKATCLRIGNVSGCDALFQAMMREPVELDTFEDGAAPRRSYVGPLTLARIFEEIASASSFRRLPEILNVAQPGTLGMDELLEAANIRYEKREARAGALRTMALDTRELQREMPQLETASAEALVAEARMAGWSDRP